MENPNVEIIDLTTFECYCNKHRPFPYYETIDLVNEPYDVKTNNKSDNVTIDKNKSKEKGDSKKTIEKAKERNTSKEKIALCSICWEKLGSKPLASTKCGHVYCLDCLKTSLIYNKHCPTCRCSLKGSSAYHPLYLELG